MSSLLDKVLELPEFKYYHKVADNDWRNPNEENASFSLSSKGWCNHTDNTSGSLSSLLPQLNVKKIYEESKEDSLKIKTYFRSRGIKLDNPTIKKLGCKVNHYFKDDIENLSIVTPLKTTKGDLIQLHKIDIDNNCHKIGKSQLLGKNIDHVDRAIIIKRPGKLFVIIEGLEDALIIMTLYPNHTILISGGAKQTRRLKGFIKQAKEVIMILDNDESETSLKYSFHLGSKAKRLMPLVQGLDANKALQSDTLQKWFDTLQEKTYNQAKELNKDSFVENEAIVDELNNKHAVISIQGKVVIMNDEFDAQYKRKVITFSVQTDFSLRYSNRTLSIMDNQGDSKQIPITKLWLSSKNRRQYDGLCFDPSEQSDDDKFFNVWRGFAYEPIDGGDCSLYYDHIFNNICKEDRNLYDYTLDWLADGIQNPTNKPGVCVIIRGGQGTGKGVFINHFRALFGQHGLYISDVKHLVGSFNAHRKECLLLFADEMFITGDKAHNSSLKALISEHETQIEYKGKDAFTFPNYNRIMMSSNERYVAPLDDDDRRFLILDIGTRNKKDYPYFAKMNKQMTEKGGYEQLMFDLSNRDLSDVNVKNFPTTDAIIENKMGSLNTVQEWLYNMIIDGTLPPLEKIETLYQQYKITCGDRPVSKHRWSHLLKDYIPGVEVRQMFGETGRHYSFPELDQCKKSFGKSIGVDLEKTFL